ncbi:BRO family protein [Spartinivicinus ruber]|uniref:BRO family protein n=1 Tax=Spartinivicinus ruber TaxID=2683272 RepID=UPI0013D3A51B|nr:phage antirepressor [Spartinivicinus ruber]
MNDLIPFQFGSSAVRVINKDGEPWFVATDVAKVLGYSEAYKMTRNLDDDEKGRQIVGTLGGDQALQVINESGLYSAILKSRRPEAKTFKKWVTNEVLPSIRKTGSYGVAQIDWSNTGQIAGLLVQSLEKVQEQTKQIEVLTPKAEFHDQVTQSDDAITIAEAAKIMGTGRNRLFKFLRDIKWVTYFNEPYQRLIEKGYLDVKLSEFDHPTQGLKQAVTALITGKGLKELKALWSQRLVA